jgi:hypothetical protein
MIQAYSNTTFVSANYKYAIAYAWHIYLSNCSEYASVTYLAQYYELCRAEAFGVDQPCISMGIC